MQVQEFWWRVRDRLGLWQDPPPPGAPPQPIGWAYASRMWIVTTVPFFLLLWLLLDAQTGLTMMPLVSVPALMLLGRLKDPDRPRYARTAVFAGWTIAVATLVMINRTMHTLGHPWPRAWSELATSVVMMLVFVAITHLPLRTRTSGSVSQADGVAP